MLNLKHAQFLELGGGVNFTKRAPGGIDNGVFGMFGTGSSMRSWSFLNIGWRHQPTLDDVRMLRAAWTPHLFYIQKPNAIKRFDPAGLIYFTLSFGIGFGYKHEDERLHRE